MTDTILINGHPAHPVERAGRIVGLVHMEDYAWVAHDLRGHRYECPSRLEASTHLLLRASKAAKGRP